MSKRKDVVKISSSKKLPTSSSKSITNIKDDSSERKTDEKVEISVKSKRKPSSLTSVKKKTPENEDVPRKSVSKPTIAPSTSSKTSTDVKLETDKRKSKSDKPDTPTSSRVTKTRFFPSKNIYANALKTRDPSKTKITDESSRRTKRSESSLSRENISTRTSLSKDSVKNSNRNSTKQNENKSKHLPRRPPAENITPRRATKQIYSSNLTSSSKPEPASLESNRSVYTSPDSSTLSERPRTATLKRGSIVNTNIVGPDAPKSKDKIKAKSPSPKSGDPEVDNYEEDFESYESDFEQYSSSTSTNLGNISGEETSSVVTDSESDAPELKEAISAKQTIASAGSDDEKKLDSGHFDMPDSKRKQMLDNIKESVEIENSKLVLNNPASLSDEGFEDQKSLQFINFLDAKKKYEHRKSVEIKQKRGKEILSMIRLDTYSFTLFDLAPVPYEIFIKNYGASNTIQSASQTAEDDIDEETQTDAVVVSRKWTQIPIKFSDIKQDDKNYWQLYKQDCFGIGSDELAEEKTQKPLFNENSLNRFIASAGELLVNILEESILDEGGNIRKNSKTLPFSDGHILFNTTGSIFEDTTVKCVSFSCDTSGRLVTVHLKKSGRGSIVSIWDISFPEGPEAVFVSYGNISCCSSSQYKLELIFTGLEDGTLSVWETRKSRLSSNNVPIYSTDIDFGHQSKIVALRPVRDFTEDYFDESNGMNEICSLDENGEIILWTVIVKNANVSDPFVTTDVLLVINARVSLQTVHPTLKDLQCTDFVISDINKNFTYISTNYGFIIHHLVKSGRANVKKFLPETNSVANCIDTCPFTPDYFLAGYENGNINLYSRMTESPLMVLSDKDSKIDRCSIQLIQWSKNKPFVIYTKDKSNTIHIWDLSESDMFPIYSIPIGKEITCMKLSPTGMKTESNKSYMMIGTEEGSLFLHQLSEEHAPQAEHIFDEQVKTFLNYVSRL